MGDLLKKLMVKELFFLMKNGCSQSLSYKLTDALRRQSLKLPLKTGAA
jgi:hypothetical protein